ncbi:MAG: hypothetical protein GY866_13910 [Proteobacteria bacterium]|nr:hypothetical protein [Pseudomonadota bacterium]
METKNKFFRNLRIQGWIVPMLLVIFFMLSVQTVQAAKEKPSWVWTEKNPKPAWWPYDHLKETSVRGGYMRTASTRYVGLMGAVRKL